MDRELTSSVERHMRLLPMPLRGMRFCYAAREDGVVPPGAAGEPGGTLALGGWTFGELFDAAGLEEEDRAAFGNARETAIHGGGWQSWSAGWELMPGERLPRKVRLIPELIKLTNRDGEKRRRGWITGHFIVYIRAGDRYLCIASGEGRPRDPESGVGALAPAAFYFHRKRGIVTAEIFAPGKRFHAGETLAEISVFFVRGFFALKDALGKLYRQGDVFQGVDFLRSPPGEKIPVRDKRGLPGGYESWYNHYTAINEGLILEDLEGLGKTENLLKRRYLDRNRPLVFQIDDGWERAVGEWEIDQERFPRGLRFIADRIEGAALIPGLWLAPFLVTRRSRLFQERPEWLLRERAGGKPVIAGFNHLWDKQYYCLDLSRDEVGEYLRGLIDRAVDQWGFRYLKLDFLYTGLFDGAFAAGGCPHEHYERACALLTARTRTASGLPVAYLGCGLPLGPSHRQFPLSRIGADTREEWDWKAAGLLGHLGRPSAWLNLRDTIGRSHLDGTVYLNDPDVVFLRSKNCKLGEQEKELIALVNFLLAGQIMFSDDPLHLTGGDLALTKRIGELYETLEDDEYGAVRIGPDVFRLESRTGRTTGIINLHHRPYTLERTRFPGLYAALSGGAFLTDHRRSVTPRRIVFAPHTISIRRSPPAG